MKKLIVIVAAAIMVLSACPVNMGMVWDANETYKAGSIAMVKVGDMYESFASLRDHNTGNYPPETLKIWWDQ